MTVSSFIPILLILSALGITYVVLHFYKQSQKGRRNPLTRDLLRSPGESLRTQSDDLTFDIVYYLILIIFVPFMMYSVYLSQKLSGLKPSSLLLLVFGLVAVLFYINKLWRVLKVRAHLRLGLDCERAVGQELNQLMLNGCRVFHDFPADKFNIDHVVVSPNGVFAVETKGRAKPDKSGGSAEATVVYDGQTLNFPDWSEKEPLDQAKRQAVWLSKWLSSAVGEQISVQPVLALPGWFIDRQKPSPDLIIFSGKNPDILLKWVTRTLLSEKLMQRVAHQLEQRCRDVEPAAYKKQ